MDKIPLLGDIPILGKLFTSQSFKEGKSELVFFITPEIVSPENNTQLNFLESKVEFTKTLEFDKKDNEHEKRVKEVIGN